ncbi:hypothetical protein [Luteolibacter sp. LG18]|uniref:hypothetical protein n=1 Tax=Luteolibacter sp. LG18 TaxID=2819286 RepID=UPI002B289A38|nr:hypothetical protein llg_42580 [Luteolibacter sp. LG18]
MTARPRIHFEFKSRSPSQREIADRLGLSQATVALALREHPDIPVVIRAEVKRVADEIGYRSHPDLRILPDHERTKLPPSRRPSLGWINAWREPARLARHPDYSGYWRGACKAASERGYYLEEFRLSPKATAEELEQQLQMKGFHGILLPPDGDPTILNLFPWKNYRIVCLSHHTLPFPANLVGPDQLGNFRLALERMHNSGYRRIGFLTDRRPEASNDKLSMAAFPYNQCDSLSEGHLPIATTAENPVPHQLAEWARSHHLDAILTDLPGAGLLLKRARLRIPEDLGLAFSCRGQIRGWAGIDCHPEEVGRLGVEILASSIHGDLDGIPSIRIAVEGHWHEGSTLPLAPEGN